jgi:predicted nuclease with TOPRIM domain
MSTAALTMLQPSSFREVQRAAAKEKLDTVSGPQRNEELLVRNERLVADLEEAQRTIDRLQWKLNASAYSQRGTEDDTEEDEPQDSGDSEELCHPAHAG